MTGAQSSNNTISKQGLDYHSNRPYQTGDPLKNIDWKHSYMLGKLTVKQYSGSQGGVGVIVADLTASDAKEADALAYDLVMSALTLANEGLPSALAVYNQKEVIAATTQAMDSRETLKKAIELTGKILIEESKGKVLQPAELQRVKRSIDQFMSMIILLFSFWISTFSAISSFSVSNSGIFVWMYVKSVFRNEVPAVCS